jgi:hypothetical protein
VPARVLISAILLGAVFILVLPRLRTVLAAVDVSGAGRWSNRIAFVVAAGMGIPIALLTLDVFFQSEAILPRFPGWVTMLKAIILIFVLNSISAFIVAFTGEPQLPKIALNGSTTAEGRLVAHVDGIWYIFDDNGKLAGIPDDKAGRVLVLPQ